MKVAELKLKSQEELRTTLRELREKIRALRFDLYQGKVKNARALQETKRDTARILTILREEELKTNP